MQLAEALGLATKRLCSRDAPGLFLRFSNE